MGKESLIMPLSRSNNERGVREFVGLVKENGFRYYSEQAMRLHQIYSVVIPQMLEDLQTAKNNLTLIKPDKGQVDIFVWSNKWSAWVKNTRTGDHDKIVCNSSKEIVLEEDNPVKAVEIKELLFKAS